MPVPPAMYGDLPLLGCGPPVRRRRRDLGHRAVITLPGFTPASVAAARQFVGTSATAWSIPRAQSRDLVQIVSEFAANAVDHAPGLRLTLRIARVPGVATVSVTDGGPARRLRVKPASADAERGRGLAIVEALADRWGHLILTPGTCVWARVAIPDRDASHQHTHGSGAAR